MAKSSLDVVDRPAPAEEPVDYGSDVRKVMNDTLAWSPEEERRALRKYVPLKYAPSLLSILTTLLGLTST
jgi:hypothetical protein